MIGSLDVLRRCRLFHGLADGDFDVLLPLFEEVDCHEHHPVFTEGGGGRALYFIARGRVRLSRTTDGGQEVTIVDLAAGDVFGEMSLLSEEPRSATARACEATVLWKLAASDFDGLAQRALPVYDTMLENLAAVLCWRLTAATTAAVETLEVLIEREGTKESLARQLEQRSTGLERILQSLRASGRRLAEVFGV